MRIRTFLRRMLPAFNTRHTAGESPTKDASSSSLLTEYKTEPLLISRNGLGTNAAGEFVRSTQRSANAEATFASSSSLETLPDDALEGLFNVRALSLLAMWYFFSFCTLFLNKYILSFMHGEPTLLGAIQMLSTTVLGFVQMQFPCGLYHPVERRGQPPGFFRNMAIVGMMRFSTVVLGLIALKYISVSFTETVKSSAPLFTVIFAYIVLGEHSGPAVIISLLPVMGGLALCSAYELSFDAIGFAAALATNTMDCLQNVFSKLLISGHEFRYTPAELQFYTSVASVVVQIPAGLFVMDLGHALSDLGRRSTALALLANGCCFHLQSITAYALMDYISPVTHSVANTVKRAMLIWLSVLVFGNEVTILSALGTTIVIAGVLFYHQAREFEARKAIRENQLGTKRKELDTGVVSLRNSTSTRRGMVLHV